MGGLDSWLGGVVCTGREKELSIFAWKGFQARYIGKIERSIYSLGKVSEQDILIKLKD